MIKIKGGVLIDCSRDAVPKIETLENFITIIAKLGYESLQLYTEDTYLLGGEPYFGRGRGAYSGAEIKRLDEYAKARGVELIPCIETLGHLEKIFEWGEYSDIRDADGVLLVGEEKTYRLIDKMFAFCAENFTSRKINIGMDEAHSLGRGNYLTKNGYRDPYEIYLEHLGKVVGIAEKYGFTPQIWSDMFFRIASGGEYVSLEAAIPDEVKAAVPRGAEITYWDYFTKDESVYRAMLEKHLSFGRKVRFACSAIKCAGFQSANAISVDRIGKGIRACEKCGVDEVLVTLWSDGGAECSPFAVLPSLTYAACCIQGEYDEDKAKDRFYELFGENYDDFMLFDLSAMPFPRCDDIGTGAKEMLYSDYFCGRMNEFVSLSGLERAAYARYAEAFAKAKKRSRGYGYVFEFYYRLARLMSVKYDLGRLTRHAYRSGDKKTLKALVKRYSATEKLLGEFLEAFRALWFTENKPNGFEVHEIRIGGVIARTKSCKNRILAYISGKIDRIEELETAEPETYPQMPYKNSYVYAATVNTLL